MLNMENNGTQNAHIQKARENAIAYYYEHHRDDKAYERFRHMPDYGRKETKNAE